MAINVSAANGLASQLASYTTQLTQARNYLSGYKNSLNSAWQAPEMAYINKAIDQTVADINNALNQLNPLSNDIRNAADEIRRRGGKRRQRWQESRNRFGRFAPI